MNSDATANGGWGAGWRNWVRVEARGPRAVRAAPGRTHEKYRSGALRALVWLSPPDARAQVSGKRTRN